MRKTGTHAGLATMLVIALATAGCGGSGGGGAGSAPSASAPPTPAPAPTPSPTPTPSGPLFGALDQTSTQQFATLGFSYRGVEVGGWGDVAVEPASVESARTIGVSFIAPSQLRLAIAGFGDGPLVPNGASGVSDGRTTQLGYNVLGGHATLLLVRRPGATYLASSAQGIWNGPPEPQGSATPIATFAYGVATPPNDVPMEGVGVYDAQFYGIAAIASAGDRDVGYHVGNAVLSVDFRSRTVTGAIEVTAEDAFATYSLTQVAFAPDGAGFTARLMRGSMMVDGFVEARFTGPSAREMIVRWSAPLQVKGKAGLLFSAWAAGRS